MNLPELHRKLLAAARGQAPDERVPCAFERRVMAHLKSGPVQNAWAAFIRPLWFGAAACALVALLLNIWSQPSMPSDEAGFSSGVEECLMSATHDGEDLW